MYSIDLSVNIGRMRLKNPVMPASGTFGYGQEYEPYIELNRLGAVIVKNNRIETLNHFFYHGNCDRDGGSR